MGGANFGAFATGLVSSLQAGQQRQAEQEYKKALIDQSKLKTKQLENELKLKEYSFQALGELSAGRPMPPMPQMASIQGPPEQSQQGLLRKLFGGGQVIPPAGQQPRGLIQKVFTGITGQPQQGATAPQPAIASGPMPVPQMVAQGQMQGQVPQGQMSPEQGKAMATDILMKQLYDLPPWQAKFQAEKADKDQEVNKYLDVGLGYVPMNRKNQVIGSMIPKAVEPHRVTVTGPDGTPYQIEQPKYGVGGGVMGGGATTLGPPPQAMPKAPTTEQEKELRDLEGNIIDLGNMISFAQDPRNKDAFGTWAAAKHKAYQEDSLKGGAGRIGIEMLPQQLGGGPPRPEVSAFLSSRQSFVNKLRSKEFGAALSEREYGEFLKETISASTPEQFIAVTSAVKDRISSQFQRMNRDIQQPYAVRQRPSLGQSPQLPQQNRQQMLENAAKARGWKKRPDGTWGP